MMTGVFNCDHRFGDGAQAGRFLKVLVGSMEDPEAFDPSNYKDLMTMEE